MGMKEDEGGSFATPDPTTRESLELPWLGGGGKCVRFRKRLGNETATREWGEGTHDGDH